MTDNGSESSSLIKQNIKRTMYSAFPEMKENKVVGNKLGEMQAKAQLDALKRFIQSMESEVVDKKRAALEQRKLNQEFDRIRQKEREISKKLTELVKTDNAEEHAMKIQLEKDRVLIDRAIPDIAGDEGYPRIYQMNKQEERQKTIKENQFIASELQKQMDETRANKKRQLQEDAEIDRSYLTGWGFKKDLDQQHYATSGNLGKMAGPTRHEHLKKERDLVVMKEVWQQANVVK